MLRSSRARHFAQNFEPDLSRGVLGSKSQLYNTFKKHRNSRTIQHFEKKTPLQGNAAAGHPSLFPKIMISEPGLALVWSGTGLVLVRFGTDTGQAWTTLLTALLTTLLTTLLKKNELARLGTLQYYFERPKISKEKSNFGDSFEMACPWTD